MEDLVSNTQIILSQYGGFTPNVFNMSNLRVFLGIFLPVPTDHWSYTEEQTRKKAANWGPQTVRESLPQLSGRESIVSNS